MPDMVSERDADISYFGPEVANRHFYSIGPPPCIRAGDHEWVNLPELARELDRAFGKHGFHTSAFERVDAVEECAECGARRPI